MDDSGHPAVASTVAVPPSDRGAGTAFRSCADGPITDFRDVLTSWCIIPDPPGGWMWRSCDSGVRAGWLGSPGIVWGQNLLETYRARTTGFREPLG